MQEESIRQFVPNSHDDFEICVFNYEKLPDTTKVFIDNFFKEKSKKETQQIRA